MSRPSGYVPARCRHGRGWVFAAAMAGALVATLPAAAKDAGAAVLRTIAGEALDSAGAKPERRVEDTLYGPSDEVEGVRIGWYVDDVVTAFDIALARKLPLVVVFSADWCEWCWSNVDEALTCRSVNRLAGYAVFAISRPEQDIAAGALARRLEVESYPVFSVLAPNDRQLVEEGRVNGFFPGDALARHLTDILAKEGYGIPPAEDPKAFAAHAPLSRTSVDPASCSANP